MLRLIRIAAVLAAARPTLLKMSRVVDDEILGKTWSETVSRKIPIFFLCFGS